MFLLAKGMREPEAESLIAYRPSTPSLIEEEESGPKLNEFLEANFHWHPAEIYQNRQVSVGYL